MLLILTVTGGAHAGLFSGRENDPAAMVRDLARKTIAAHGGYFADNAKALERVLTAIEAHDFSKPATRDALQAVADYRSNGSDTNYAALVWVYILASGYCPSGDDIAARIALHEAAMLDGANTALREKILHDAAGFAAYTKILQSCRPKWGSVRD
jgi:hypothetical protein